MIKKKNICVFIYIILLMLLIFNRVCADTTSAEDNGLTQGEQTTNPVKWSEVIQDGNTNRGIRYRYKMLITSKNDFSINAYDMSGNSLIPDSISQLQTEELENKFKAGTWIGININEKQTANWNVWDFEYQKAEKKYNCVYGKEIGTCYKTITEINVNRYDCIKKQGSFKPYKEDLLNGDCEHKVPTSCVKDYNNITITSEAQPYFEEYQCPQKYTTSDGTRQLVSGPTVAETIYTDISNVSNASTIQSNVYANARTQAINRVGSASGKVVYITNNSYPNSKEELATNELSGTRVPNEIQADEVQASGNAWANYQYFPSKVCINLKTSEVTYEEKCIPDQEKGIIEIQNETTYDKYLNENITYWHYFIPLNTKTSKENFYIQIAKNTDKKLNVNECKSYMEKYNTPKKMYTNYIVPATSSLTFKDDYGKLKMNSDAWKEVQKGNGCYFTTIVKIPVVQKFYNEEQNNNNQIIFKGFNFYYRAIDINNPFPNGIAADSYWYEWGQSQKANQNPTPDLSESFTTKTYEAKNINVSAVREYNEEHPYTSWDEMNINGSSSLINSNKINNTLIERIGNNKDYYKLGCGPANEDWEECR